MHNITNCTDEQLFSLLKEGNEFAFNVLFERYRDKLFTYILRHIKSKEVAEEIVIDIFVKLWIGRELVSHIQSPAAFFHKVAWYKAMDFLRTTARHSRLQQVYIDRAAYNAVQKPDDLLIDDEARTLLLDAINHLPPKRKLIYQLSREEGLSHEDIARALNLSKSTVNNSITAATVSIAGYLKKNLAGKAALTSTLPLFLLS